MNCSGCGFEVQSGFAFCPKCGTKQPNACPGCGYLCAPDFAFCPKCGAQVAEAPKAGRQRPRRDPATLPSGPSAPPLPSGVEADAHFDPAGQARYRSRSPHRHRAVCRPQRLHCVERAARPRVDADPAERIVRGTDGSGAELWRLRRQIHRRCAARFVRCAGRA